MGILNDYRLELEVAERWKAEGRTMVSATVAGPIANGRSEVPIDEYIAMWQDGITKMEAGAPEKDFEY